MPRNLLSALLPTTVRSSSSRTESNAQNSVVDPDDEQIRSATSALVLGYLSHRGYSDTLRSLRQQQTQETEMWADLLRPQRATAAMTLAGLPSGDAGNGFGDGGSGPEDSVGTGTSTPQRGKSGVKKTKSGKSSKGSLKALKASATRFALPNSASSATTDATATPSAEMDLDSSAVALALDASSGLLASSRPSGLASAVGHLQTRTGSTSAASAADERPEALKNGNHQPNRSSAVSSPSFTLVCFSAA